MYRCERGKQRIISPFAIAAAHTFKVIARDGDGGYGTINGKFTTHPYRERTKLISPPSHKRHANEDLDFHGARKETCAVTLV